MIATLIFSVILLSIMVGVTSFTRSYYKGVNTSSTQSTARLALEKVSQTIQFSGGDISFAPSSGPITTYCIGNVQFDFAPGVQINGTSTHALWRTPRSTSGPCMQSLFIASGAQKSQELLGNHMRLSVFTITPSSVSGAGALVTVHMRVVYGGDDLLLSPSGATPVSTANDVTCQPQSGSQFCSFSNLTVTVQKRIQ